MSIPRILFFAHDSSLYGASQSLLTLIEGITDNNFAEIFVILPHRGIMEEKLKLLKINYEVIPFPRCFIRNMTDGIFKRIGEIYRYNLKFRSVLPAINKVIRKFNPQLIYSNTSIVSIGYFVAKKNKLPHVWHIREFGDLDYHLGYIPSRKRLLADMRMSSRLIFVSQALQKHWLGNNLNNSCVIYNGVINQPSNTIINHLDKAKPTFALLGAIMPGKGQETAIRAMAIVIKNHPEAILSLYGNVFDKPYHQKLINLISEFKMYNNVFFFPFEQNQNLLYSKLNVLLNCSVMEGFGRTIIEAMSRGIPVIANASGGPLEIIKNNENGLLYNHTPESLALNMNMLLSNTKLYNTLAENGMHHALKFSITSYVKSICEAFDEVLVKK